MPLSGARQRLYEWPTGVGGKSPLWIHRTDERPFALAGIYNVAPDAAASVVTGALNSLMASIHHRMPVVLDADDYDAWLDPDADPGNLRALLQPREWPEWAARLVSTAVNRAGNDGPQLTATAPVAVPQLL